METDDRYDLKLDLIIKLGPTHPGRSFIITFRTSN